MNLNNVNDVINSLKSAFIIISNKLNEIDPLTSGKIVSKNESDDDVKKLDLYANDILLDILKKNKNVRIIASEENKDLIYTENKNGEYLISFDPLDGSSNIDSNITTGTIFCIFKADNIKDKKFNETILCSGYCLYGGCTQLIYTIKDNKTPIINNYILENKTKFIKKEDIKMPKYGNIYSINESNKYKWDNNKKYNELIDEFIKKGYTQRYVGSLVADAHRTLIKGGYFSYPLNKDKTGRIRVLYEAIPICFLIEQAGGYSFLNSSGEKWSDKKFPDNIHEKTGITLCSKYEQSMIEYYIIM